MTTSLVTSIKDVLRPYKKSILGLLPREYRIRPAVVQAYIGGDLCSRYTLVNFPSLYSPATAYPCKYDLALYSQQGKVIDRATVALPVYGSMEVRPEEVFQAALPEFGMFAARLRPTRPLIFADRHLGEITSHFYALYTDATNGSSVLVHPQTRLDSEAAPTMSWQSNHLLDAAKIRRLEAFQINPSADAVQSSLYLTRDGRERIAPQQGIIPAYGSRKLSWDVAALGLTEGYIFVGAEGLPAENAKPILILHFADGRFTGMHA